MIYNRYDFAYLIGYVASPPYMYNYTLSATYGNFKAAAPSQFHPVSSQALINYFIALKSPSHLQE